MEVASDLVRDTSVYMCVRVRLSCHHHKKTSFEILTSGSTPPGAT